MKIKKTGYGWKSFCAFMVIIGVLVFEVSLLGIFILQSRDGYSSQRSLREKLFRDATNRYSIAALTEEDSVDLNKSNFHYGIIKGVTKSELKNQELNLSDESIYERTNLTKEMLNALKTYKDNGYSDYKQDDHILLHDYTYGKYSDASSGLFDLYWPFRRNFSYVNSGSELTSYSIRCYGISRELPGLYATTNNENYWALKGLCMANFRIHNQNEDQNYFYDAMKYSLSQAILQYQADNAENSSAVDIDLLITPDGFTDSADDNETTQLQSRYTIGHDIPGSELEAPLVPTDSMITYLSNDDIDRAENRTDMEISSFAGDLLYFEQADSTLVNYTVVSYVPAKLDTKWDDYFVRLDRVIGWLAIAPVLCPILLVASLLSVVLFLFQYICAAGHHTSLRNVNRPEGYRTVRENEYIEKRYMDYMPLDLYGIIVIILQLMGFAFMYSFNGAGDPFMYFFLIIEELAIILLGQAYLTSFVINVKVGDAYKNTLIYIFCHWIYKEMKQSDERIMKKGLIAGLQRGSNRLLLVFSILEFLAMGILTSRTTLKGLVFPLWVAWIIKQAILIYYRNKYLSEIERGFDEAVTERLKSEHMQTELITNVSHDIRTPLTSIINYVDLLSKEDLKNDKAVGYIEVLSRQSLRLKKLITDLIDASKASTGVVKLHMEKLDCGVLLSMAAGEYEERFQEKQIEFHIEKKTEKPLMITADSRQLWRVFDNLLTNMVKYSQVNTRAYVDLVEENGSIKVIFRNTSAAMLHVSAEELMERFVRGDSSRSTEGSGLGLSIARSLTQLMGGDFQLFVDGDLFKVEVAFPMDWTIPQ